jgi:excisionase family DNA binding protein
MILCVAMLSVAQAADLLDVRVQRVHQLIADGSLRAERVGRQWVVNDADLVRLDRRPAGRPLSARSAWELALLAVASDNRTNDSLARLSPASRSRARARLRGLLGSAKADSNREHASPLEQALAAKLRLLLQGRADRFSFRASPRDLDDLRADQRVQLSGVSLPESGIAAGDIVEGYVSADELDELVHDFLLSESGHAEANVVLHVPKPSVPVDWVRPDNWLVLAADLAEHHRPRESSRAAQLVLEAAAMADSGAS